MKISVITACYNSAATIEDTLRSVCAQDYPDIEYIIIDGESKDDTLAIVEKYRSRITRVESGRDGGIYFALNKGISLATGDVIALLHSDDFYADNTVLRRVAETFEKEKCDSVYGDLHYVDQFDTARIVRRWKSGPYKPGLFRKGWMPPHPAFFLKRTCYEKFGTFNTSFRTAADYELMLRMLEKNKISTCYLPETLVKMRTGGASNASFKARVKANREDRRAWTVNDLQPGLLTLLRKPLSKLKQFL